MDKFFVALALLYLGLILLCATVTVYCLCLGWYRYAIHLGTVNALNVLVIHTLMQI